MRFDTDNSNPLIGHDNKAIRRICRHIKLTQLETHIGVLEFETCTTVMYTNDKSKNKQHVCIARPNKKKTNTLHTRVGPLS